MGTFNYRRYHDTIKDAKGDNYERISIIEVWYNDEGEPQAYALLSTEFLTQYSEPNEQIDNKEAELDTLYKLGGLIQAFSKPILTEEDFKPEARPVIPNNYA